MVRQFTLHFEGHPVMFYQAVNKVLNVIAAKAIINHIETFTSADVATKT